MRIVIDMQGAQTESRFRGIGRYTRSLAQAIVRNRGEHEIILALSGLFPHTIEPIRAAFDGLLPQANIRVWYAPGPVRECEPGNEWRREVAELIREAFLASLKPDVVYVSSLFEGYVDDAVTSIGVFAPEIPTVVTLYDLIPLLNPDTYLKPNPSYEKCYRQKIEYLKKAAVWCAISDSAADEGRETLGLDPSLVINISTACDSVFRLMQIQPQDKEQLFQRFSIAEKPYVMYSGGADGRKNLPRLIRSYAQLPLSLRDKHQLVFAGKMPDGEVLSFKAEAKAAGLRPGELLFTGYVTDEELAILYNLCTVFVFPSVHEGFGLPALEAMACGAVVIGANTTSVPEVIGRTEAMFDPYNEAEISQKLVQVLEDETFRAELAAHGLEQAKKFSWDESARRAMGVFEYLYSLRLGKSKGLELQNVMPDLITAIAAVVPPKLSDEEILSVSGMLRCIHVGNEPKQLFVDISELVQRDAKTGVQRVTRSILNELLESPPEGYVVEPVYATTSHLGYRYARHFIANFRGMIDEIDDDVPIDCQPGDIFLGLDLQHHVVAAQKEYLAVLRQDGVKVFFVVYDLLPVLMPHVFPVGSDTGHKVWLETLMGFDGALCISQSVAIELEDWQRVHNQQRLRPFKIDWFHLGADVNNSVPTLGLPDNANHVLEELVRRPTFLIVGTIEPRKGQAQALGAFELLWEEGVDVNLVIVGKQGWMVEKLVKKLRNHPAHNKHLFWLESISDEYLGKVYAASTCLVAASEGEGFGLPLIEAAQHKLPIIARDIHVFREVSGEHAFYFNGDDARDLTEAITAWLTLYKYEKHPTSDGMPWLTWKQSAENLIDKLMHKIM
jgi:glycosyltransferase involved in cell wall biosynthesis